MVRIGSTSMWRPTPSTSRTTGPTRTGTPCRCSTGPRATARTGTAALRAATRFTPAQPVRPRRRSGDRHGLCRKQQFQRRVRGRDQRRHLQRQDQDRLRAVAGPGADRVEPRVPGPRWFVAHPLCAQRGRRHDLRDRHQVLQRHRGLRMLGAPAERAGHVQPAGVGRDPECVRAGSADRHGVRGERRRAELYSGGEHPSLQRDRQLRLPARGAERARLRVPDGRRPGDKHDLRRQRQPAADRRDQRQHVQGR